MLIDEVQRQRSKCQRCREEINKNDLRNNDNKNFYKAYNCSVVIAVWVFVQGRYIFNCFYLHIMC